MQSSFDNVVQQIRQAGVDGNVLPPYIVVEVGEFNPINDWGLQNRFKWAKLRISYVIKMTDLATNSLAIQTNQEAVQSQIYALSETLDATDTNGSGNISPKYFRPVENGQIDSSATMPYNEAFRNDDVKLWACSLYYTEGVMVGNLGP